MSIAQLYGLRRLVRLAFFFLSAAFAASVTIQIFIAGLAVFVDPVNWLTHNSFVNILLPMPLLMLLLAFTGRLPRNVQWQSAAFLGLIFVQHITANSSEMLSWAAAAHPVIAMVLFWISVRIATNGWRLAFDPDLDSDLKHLKDTGPAPATIAETDG